MSDVLIAVPARYGSSRLPGKILKKLAGKPVIQHVYEQCLKAGVGDVLIATESPLVVEACARFGAKAILTSEACQSGTDRIYEAAQGRTEKYIINVQGDEPFISPSTITKMADILKSDPACDIATAVIATLDDQIIDNPNCVKAVLTPEMKALYFSRSRIPYKRQPDEAAQKAPYWKHCGIYGYKREALEKFVHLPVSPLEKLEKLEQLRALEAGMTIKCAQIEPSGPAIDTEADLAAAEKYLQTK